MYFTAALTILLSLVVAAPTGTVQERDIFSVTLNFDSWPNESHLTGGGAYSIIETNKFNETHESFTFNNLQAPGSNVYYIITVSGEGINPSVSSPRAYPSPSKPETIYVKRTEKPFQVLSTEYLNEPYE